jgi:hypothetical protein
MEVTSPPWLLQVLGGDCAMAGALEVAGTSTLTQLSVQAQAAAPGTPAALAATSSAVTIAQPLDINAPSSFTKTISINPSSTNGGGLAVSNGGVQTSGDLVSIEGEAGQSALRVSAGGVTFDDGLIVAGQTHLFADVMLRNGVGMPLLHSTEVGLQISQPVSITSPSAIALEVQSGKSSHGWRNHFHAPLYTPFVNLHTKQTGRGGGG